MQEIQTYRYSIKKQSPYEIIANDQKIRGSSVISVITIITLFFITVNVFKCQVKIYNDAQQV